MADLMTLTRSPLAHLEDRLRDATVNGDRAVRLRELPFLTMISVRTEPGSPAFDRISTALGATLPTGCGTVAHGGDHTALWLGPDEWLVVSPVDTIELVPALVGALDADPGAVVDVSANRTTLELSGPSARAALEKGCPADLHARVFGPGRAVSTTLGPVPLVLWQVDPTTYRLLPRASFADYVARWLMDAMTEYAAPEVA